MTEPNWLDLDFMLSLQTELLAKFGGLEGVREPGLLDSALNRPLHLFAYDTPTLFALAASYTYGIVKNHPFLDGNKRAGFMAAYTFLGMNGYHLQAPETDAVLMTVDLAAGKIEPDLYARWLEQHSKRKKREGEVSWRHVLDEDIRVKGIIAGRISAESSDSLTR
ncbi:MAG: type II toxin-antitoxin system death-on-curing family toxin [Kiritimatiellia bacterium]